MIDENSVDLDEKGKVIIRFAYPVVTEPGGVPTAFFFGNVRGVEVLSKKEKIIGVTFDSVKVLKLFHKTTGWPKDFDFILAIIEDIKQERETHISGMRSSK
jgi:hypothetical protein